MIERIQSKIRRGQWVSALALALVALAPDSASAQMKRDPKADDPCGFDDGYEFGLQTDDAALSAFYPVSNGRAAESSYATMLEAFELGYYGHALDHARSATRWVIQCAPGEPFARLRAEHNEGVAEAALGRNADARRHFQRLIDWKRTHPASHAPVIALLNLGNLERREGNLKKARELLELAEKGQQPTGYPIPPTKVHGSLGVLLFELGDTKGARRRFEQALKTSGGQGPLFLATIESNLALVDARESKLQSAYERLERVLSLRAEENVSKAVLAVTLNNLAEVERQRGKLAEAEQLVRKALAQWSEKANENLPVLGNMQHTLAQIQRARADYDGAFTSYELALATLEGALGSHHPLVAMVLDDAGSLEQARGNSAQALPRWERSAAIYERGITRFLAGASEAQRRGYMALVRKQTDVLLSAHFESPSTRSGELVARLILQRKGRSLDIAAASERPSTPELVKARRELAALAFGGPDSHGLDAQQFGKRVEQLGDMLEQSARGSAVSTLVADDVVSQVRERLQPEERLVEFVRFRKHDPRTGQFGEELYCALTLSKREPPRLVALGAARPIDARVAAYRGALAGQRAVEREARALFDALLAPLELGRGERLLIAPDAGLNLIPFEALQSPNGELLVERHELSYSSSGRDVLQAPLAAAPGGQFVVVADPEFQEPGPFPRLPGTREEALEIRELFPDAELIMGEEATITAFDRVRRPSVLHVASHGFFLPAPGDSVEAAALATRALVLQRDRPVAVGPTINPLARSGLILAPDERSPRGIVSALELANDDLRGTQLVVLSACETGLGDLEDGQGVYGLRRALVLAGSQRQVVSLWKVDDEATRKLMTEFYRELTQAKSVHDALRTAKARLRATPEYAHPYYWAAFIASGPDAPLQLSSSPKTRLSSHGCACTVPAVASASWSWLWCAPALAFFGRRRRAFQPAASTTRVSSGGAPRRTGGPTTPKPRFT